MNVARSLRMPLRCACGADGMVGPKGERYADCLECYKAAMTRFRTCRHQTRPSTGRCRCGALRKFRSERYFAKGRGPNADRSGWQSRTRATWEPPSATPVD